jgi:hypothetical protein
MGAKERRRASPDVNPMLMVVDVPLFYGSQSVDMPGRETPRVTRPAAAAISWRTPIDNGAASWLFRLANERRSAIQHLDCLRTSDRHPSAM